MKILFACTIFFLSTFYLYGQVPISIQISENEGLPDTEFYDILEDDKSFLWLAADKGLFRYNGKNFRAFNAKNQRGNAVFGLFKDSKNRVWCNNIAGQFLVTNSESLEVFIDLSTTLNGELTEFIVTNEELVVFTAKNIFKVSLSTKQIKQVCKNVAKVGAIHKYLDGYQQTISNYIFDFDLQYKKRDSIHIPIFDNNKIHRSISKKVNIVSIKNNSLCYFFKENRNEFYVFDLKVKDYQKIKTPKELKSCQISSVFVKGGNELWFNTDVGLFVFEYFANNLNLKYNFFSSKFVTKVIKDNANNYWLTTIGNGIYIIPNLNILKYDFGEKFEIITTIAKHTDHSIVFGSNKGDLGVYDLQNKNIKKNETYSLTKVSKIFPISSYNSSFIVKDDKAFKFNTNGLKLLKNNIFGAKSISEYKKDSLIITSYKSAFIVNSNFDCVKKIYDKRCFNAYYSEKNKKKYIATIDGLLSIKDGTNTFVFFNKKPIYANSISETENGIIWVSTFKDGIYGIKENKVVKHLTTETQLLSNQNSFLESDGNKLWIAGSNGLQVYDVISGKIKSLTRTKGLLSNKITGMAIFDSIVFLGSNKGLFSIHKTQAFEKRVYPEVYFSNVEITGKDVEIKSNYSLNHNFKSIKFHFNTNGFHSKHTRYEYRLINANDKWSITDKNVGSVTYNNLPFGSYIFEVRAKLNTNVKKITFNVLRPFWRTWWFYILVASSLFLLVFLIFKLTIKKLKKSQIEALNKEMISKQLVMSQLENLRSQMNPHFIFNALNSIQEYIVLNEKDLASSYLIKFSRLIRIYLDHSREDEVLLSEEIKALKIYLELEKNRFEELLTYEVTISKEIDTTKVKIPSLFIQPYIENALKHGLLHKKEDRKLTISFNYLEKSNTLICEVLDNGIGVEASKKINQQRSFVHKSFATSANQKRVSLLNTNRDKKIVVHTTSPVSMTNTGTKVSITIPL